MYYTAPGHRHIQVLVPQAHRASAALSRPAGTDRPAGSVTHTPAADVEPVVAEALNAALSKDRATSMMAWRFAPAVRAHIRARQRAAVLASQSKRSSPAAGKVRIRTCHAREGGEFFGTVEAADGTKKAYAAKIQDGKLVSFKVL